MVLQILRYIIFTMYQKNQPKQSQPFINQPNQLQPQQTNPDNPTSSPYPQIQRTLSTQPQSQPQSSTVPNPPKPKNNLSQITVLKRTKISHYPYYPVTHTYAHGNGLNYIFGIELQSEGYSMVIAPFRETYENGREESTVQELQKSYIELECVPRRNVNFLYVLEYDDVASGNGKGVLVRLVDFVLGFSAGFLIRCRYKNYGGGIGGGRMQGGLGNRELEIIGKYNKKPDYKEGFMMRMTTSFFGSDQFYKVAVQKPVRNFQQYPIAPKPPLLLSPQIPTQKYRYSYLIGNRLYLSTQFTPQLESQTLSTFKDITWQQMPLDTMAKLHKPHSTIINSKRHRTLITANSMLIEWTDQIASYVYTEDNQLIVADNEENKIIVFSVLDNLRIRAVYEFGLDVKRLRCFRLEGGRDGSGNGVEVFLIVLPYDSNLYIINLTRNEVVSLIGHKSYITQACITPTRYIITGGCDHRISLKDLKTIKDWLPIPLSSISPYQSPLSTKLQQTLYYQIPCERIPQAKMSETYFLGEFNNVNSERNNNNNFGFGSFLGFNERVGGRGASQVYVFLSFDFLVKVYRITV